MGHAEMYLYKLIILKVNFLGCIITSITKHMILGVSDDLRVHSEVLETWGFTMIFPS